MSSSLRTRASRRGWSTRAGRGGLIARSGLSDRRRWCGVTHSVSLHTVSGRQTDRVQLAFDAPRHQPTGTVRQTPRQGTREGHRPKCNAPPTRRTRVTPPSTTDADPVEDAARANALRDKLVDALMASGTVRSTQVEAALRTVPRHRFLPGVPLDLAYANEAVVTKRDDDGASMSSVSAPVIVAMMLEQLQVAPGHRVLEIGSGGYNAALLAELVGADGQVTTIDIDPEVIDRARLSLAETGYRRVRVLCGDGEAGAVEATPFDRIIVTVGAWDLAPAWLEQLVDGGRIVVPLRMRGLTRSVAFERDGDRLVGRSVELCGFVPMQGAGAYREQLVWLHADDVALRVDDGQSVDAEALAGALTSPRVQTWTGVTVATGESFEHLDLWLATAMPGFGLLAVRRSAIDAEVVAPALSWGCSAAFEGGTLAYLSLRPSGADPGTGRKVFEFGVTAHGPEAKRLADQVGEQIRAWNTGHRGGAGLRIEAHPAGTPVTLPAPALVIDKRHVRLTVSWA
ncbi:MAG: methyltransferase, FxLD system [Dactylosporangium sp.]|nr:methyltransferase, FxLD system [Dactylosporangium sp.]NNJ61915.1 methyltransferase, FxLD system [Dactylosporangium sp.]